MISRPLRNNGIGAFFALVLLAFLVAPSVLRADLPAAEEYLVYVVCEAADKIALVSFGPQGARVVRTLATGNIPVDINGPHGIVISPDKQFYYVSIAHGRPFGSAWKYRTRDDAVVGRVELGMFPATADITPDGNFLYVVNFNLHGDMVPSSVSVVATDAMVEATRIPTCAMPHGSRLNPQGTRHYSACMMDDMLIEIDTQAFRVSRYFLLTKGKEVGLSGSPTHALQGATHSGPSGDSVHAINVTAAKQITCSPTWAQPSPDGSEIFVACNQSNEIIAIGSAEWKITRRISAGPGVYNLAVTKDHRLIATNKKDQSVSVFNADSGSELARIPTHRKLPHGIAVSPDNRYAFVTVEGRGTEPGTLEIIDLQQLQTVATVDLPEQAAGVDFYRMQPGAH